MCMHEYADIHTYINTQHKIHKNTKSENITEGTLEWHEANTEHISHSIKSEEASTTIEASTRITTC